MTGEAVSLTYKLAAAADLSPLMPQAWNPFSFLAFLQ